MVKDNSGKKGIIRDDPEIKRLYGVMHLGANHICAMHAGTAAGKKN
jgi:hypothetical protein